MSAAVEQSIIENNENLSKTYQKKTDKQHVLENPDTYTGSMEATGYETYVMDGTDIKHKDITIIPGLYKLFDEAIVNCRDHHIRQEQNIEQKKENMLPVTNIEIEIKDGIITMQNDGNGIDVVKHPEHDLWIPEMIFAHLRTSTNYNKDQKKIVGGKNGFGFKLVLIWSTWGKIETIDHIRGLKYTQEYHNNLDVIDKPKINKCTSKKPFTRVSFKPDLARLGLTELSEDMMNLFKRRIMDIAAITGKKVKVKFNGDVVPVKQFSQYIDLYIGKKADKDRVYEEANERWEYAVSLAPKEEFTQVSFVNGIFTSKGGKHVEYILGQITKKLIAFIKKKKKVDVKPSTIKEQIMLFVRCDVENPSFDSQTKDYLTTNISKFGSTCEVSDKFIEKIAKLGIMDAACALTSVKEIKEVKKNDGWKSKTLRGYPKLLDADDAGTAKSSNCILILCEGDSAKAGIVSGMSKEDRKYIGVFPLKGKLFNVRGETQKRIADNKEIHDIKHIVGLEVGKKYTEESMKKCLRYGKVIFMTDQDLDGSHIKGLGVNLFDSEWKTLIDVPNFIGFMNTPILKATKGNSHLVFYNDGEYNKWKEDNNTTGWKIKYYKGLGTSTSKEFKEYFSEKKFVYFTSTESSKNSIDMAFNKKRAGDRKEWLGNYDPTDYLDTNQTTISYEDFINKEMIHFSIYDNERSIPCIVDGLKTSLRKILFTVFKRNLTKEIKVAQLSGSVSEMSGYHHGEASLNGGIIHMAQNFVGSNNINYLKPNGQFGTRLAGGSDAASERYIFTEMSNLTRLLFKNQDDPILKYLDDDGLSVEPQFYVPIIPTILVNGTKGIGTGFSSEVLSYDPRVIISYLNKKLKDENTDDIQFIPYYEGFKGKISSLNEDNSKFLIKGCYEIISPTRVRVTELPIGTWTTNYKEFIENLIDVNPGKKTKAKGYIREYIDMCTEKDIDFTITFAPNIIDELIKAPGDYEGSNGLEKVLKLYTTKNTTNMYLFDEKQKLRLFKNPQQIIDNYMSVRFDTYVLRKKYILDKLAHELMILTNKVKFINGILDDSIILKKKKEAEVYSLLTYMGFDMIDNSFKYLTKMPFDSLTEEEVDNLKQKTEYKRAEHDKILNTTEINMWLDELKEFDEAITTQKNLSKIDNPGTDKSIIIKIKKKTKK